MEKDRYDIKQDLFMGTFKNIYYRQIEDMKYKKFSNKDENIQDISEETVHGFINSLTFEDGFADNDAFIMCYSVFDGMFEKFYTLKETQYYDSPSDYDKHLGWMIPDYSSDILKVFVRDGLIDSLNRNILWYLYCAERNKTYINQTENSNTIQNQETQEDQSQQVE